MGLIKEIKTFRVEVFKEEPILHCKEFEDNSGAIDLERISKIHPHTKKSTLYSITSVNMYVRDLYIYNKLLRMTSALPHGLSRFHRTFS